MSRAAAIADGFDFEGTYCFIPIYFRQEDYTVLGKNALCNVLVVFAAWLDRCAMWFTGAEDYALYLRSLQ